VLIRAWPAVRRYSLILMTILPRACVQGHIGGGEAGQVDKGVDAVGSRARATKRRTCAHLIEIAQNPTVKVLIVPASADAHVGLTGPFVIAEFRDPPEMAYLDTAAQGQIADHPAAPANRLRCSQCQTLLA
jgi:Domain of unknown function (DUF5753)